MYTVSIRRRVIKDLENIPSDYVQLIMHHIDDLEQNPYPPDAKKLKDDSGYSQRVGVYRILYDIDNTARIVTVYRVKHRREAYR